MKTDSSKIRAVVAILVVAKETTTRRKMPVSRLLTSLPNPKPINLTLLDLLPEPASTCSAFA
jgi:hypothetical protein